MKAGIRPTTMELCPVVDISGHVLFRQATPKLRWEKAKVLNFPQTPHDIESRLLHTLRIIKIVRGE